MEKTKEITITPPKGYEIDTKNSTFEKIVFKAIKNKKPTWEDFGKVKGYCINSCSNIIEVSNSTSSTFYENTFPTKEEAEACLALSQLCQWRDKYNGGWKSDFTDNSTKYCIIIEQNKIMKVNFTYANKILAFKTSEVRDKFLEDFRDLIQIAKPLL